MSILQAIQYNNQAVVFLEDKLFNDAILWSFSAMEMFQQHQHTAADQVSHQQGSDPIDQLILDHDHIESSDDTMNEFIYEHGIVLPTTALDPCVIAPVLIFNCALSHQLAATHCKHHDGLTCHTYLRRAQGLYDLACSQQDQDMNEIFMFAMANNIGVIHKRLCNYEESKRCFDNLVSSMMVLIDVGVESKRLQRIQGFWKNVSESNASMAPAA